MDVSVILPVTLAELLNDRAGIELIDVCSPVEYREMHVESAANHPLDLIDPARFMESRKRPADEPLYVICRSGRRSRKACEKFMKGGFANVVSVEGGTAGCLESGVPVVRGKRAVSLERQVRMVVGSMVLLGIMLGWFLSPAFFFVSAFMGAGLLFAGITDNCAMAILLARMPWNQCHQAKDYSCSSFSS